MARAAHIDWNSPRARKFAVGISLLLGLSCGGSIALPSFFFAAAWLQGGLPILFMHWQDQPTARVLLSVLFFAMAVGGIVGGLIAGRLWLRFLRREGFLGTAWVALPGEIIFVAKFELVLLPILGAAAVLSILMPLSLWVIGGTALLSTVWQRLPSPPPMVMALGGFTGAVAGTIWAALLAKRLLRLSDDELKKFVRW